MRDTPTGGGDGATDATGDANDGTAGAGGPGRESLVARGRRGLADVVERPVTWVVLLADRLLVAALLTAAFAGAVLAIVVGVVDLDTETQLNYLFSALVGGNLTLLTIVLSINQLVLSREFNAPGELRERIDGVVAFRERVEETADQPTVPVRPSAFLRTLLAGTSDTARALAAAVADESDEALEADVAALVAGITDRADEGRRELEHSEADVFGALVEVLETNYSRQLNDARRLQAAHADALSGDAEELLAELIDALERIDVARQYFKSIYMQSTLARLSRLLLWVGVPAIGSALCMLFVYASDPSTAVQPAPIRALVPVVVVLAFVPLAVLFAFVLQIATVAERTVAITPFTTAPQEKVLDEE